MNIQKLKSNLKLIRTQMQSLTDQLTFFTMMHFQGVEMNDDVSCSDCKNFRAGVCPGEDRQGEAVLDCMMNHLETAEFDTSGFTGGD